MTRISALVVLLLVVAPAHAFEAGDTIEGYVTVVDGDTIEVDEQRIRLFGIDAPERNEPGGAASERALRTEAKGQHVRCQVMHVLQFGQDQRPMAVCHIQHGGAAKPPIDLGASMISKGQASASRDFLHDSPLEGAYRWLELEAWADCRGIWLESPNCPNR